MYLFHWSMHHCIGVIRWSSLFSIRQYEQNILFLFWCTLIRSCFSSLIVYSNAFIKFILAAKLAHVHTYHTYLSQVFYDTMIRYYYSNAKNSGSSLLCHREIGKYGSAGQTVHCTLLLSIQQWKIYLVEHIFLPPGIYHCHLNSSHQRSIRAVLVHPTK